jgi:hypothetical protein
LRIPKSVGLLKWTWAVTFPCDRCCSSRSLILQVFGMVSKFGAWHKEQGSSAFSGGFSVLLRVLRRHCAQQQFRR